MYARDRGLGEPCNEEELGEYLVTETSRLKHKNCLSLLSGKADCPLEEPDSLAENELDVMMDTVGVICRDRNGNVSAGVSSGGILLKRPGRVGEAAMFGCGCYALNLASQSNAAKESAACSVSGCGEHVMKTRLAEKCCSSAFLNSSDGRKGGLYDSLRVTLQDFLDHPWLSHIPQRLCGLVVLHEYVNEALK